MNKIIQWTDCNANITMQLAILSSFKIKLFNELSMNFINQKQ